jgi:hypothetical protein
MNSHNHKPNSTKFNRLIKSDLYLQTIKINLKTENLKEYSVHNQPETIDP